MSPFLASFNSMFFRYHELSERIYLHARRKHRYRVAVLSDQGVLGAANLDMTILI